MKEHVVVDALGTVAKVGDEVVMAQAGKGALEFIKGRIDKVNQKTVLIAHGRAMWQELKREYQWVDDYSKHSPRRAGCFVIVRRGYEW